ncbi:nuclear transport factor 2 family protein [Streptomyces sp. NBC_01317]|uniref:nuclear transport factor 2 family protein n=1 Tax=Streptomyces sp. NBC_01317 TaxID=2903822 RepID=UPI002E13F230|nr:nuclear transport factor 2 family protein [Streptomyces sp. NBC_01317]
MTQRVELATLLDRLAIDEVITSYAVAVEDADWPGFLTLFTPEGRADYTAAGGGEGPADQVAEWLAGELRPFAVRQQLIVNRRVRFQDADGYPGNHAELTAGYLLPLRHESGEDVMSGGRIVFRLLRGESGWRLSRVVVQEQWRRGADVPGGVPAAG